MQKIIVLVLSSLIFLMSQTRAENTSLNVEITGGAIQGTKIDHTRAWLGIPFAQPPIGELRWQPPQPVISWEGVKTTTHYGKDCQQKAKNIDAAPAGVGYSEDCLTLNVWRPDNAKHNLPVMVWIYGGGFVNGGASPAVYSGKEFAKQGVILVSFNYRVGRFGFFAHPALAHHPLRGNYGLMDQLAALKWVQTNIGAFGGDSANVTVFGESAGGMSIHALLTHTDSQGLFHKAIIQSGSGRYNLMKGQSWQQAEKAAIKFAAQQGITGQGEQALAQLRQLSTDTLVGDLNMSTMFNDTYSGPMIDGTIISGEPQQYYERGQFIPVPLLVGVTAEEIAFPPSVKTMDDALEPFAENDKPLAKYLFSGLSPQRTALVIEQHKFMNEPARYIARVWAKNAIPVWAYRFAYVADSMKNKWSAAPHASENPYVFNTLESKFANKVTGNDLAVASVVQRYWINFAKTGNPNAVNLPEWEQYSAYKDRILFVPLEGAEKISTIKDPRQQTLDLIEKINH